MHQGRKKASFHRPPYIVQILRVINIATHSSRDFKTPLFLQLSKVGTDHVSLVPQFPTPLSVSDKILTKEVTIINVKQGPWSLDLLLLSCLCLAALPL